MTRAFLAVILCCVPALTIATDVQRVSPAVQERAVVLDELSQRSGLPVAEVGNLLADCHANQQSMYFCAWRDQIAADRIFWRTLAEKLQKMPQCKTSMEAKIASWAKTRDRSCEKSAMQEWGEGSMKPTAQAICVTAETVRMTKRLGDVNVCEFK